MIMVRMLILCFAGAKYKSSCMIMFHSDSVVPESSRQEQLVCEFLNTVYILMFRLVSDNLIQLHCGRGGDLGLVPGLV